MSEVAVSASLVDVTALRRAAYILVRIDEVLDDGKLDKLADSLNVLADRIDRAIGASDPRHWRLPDYSALSRRLENA